MASTRLTRTPSNAGNSKTFTISTWLKRGTLGAYSPFVFVKASNDNNDLQFTSGDQLKFLDYRGSYNFQLITTRVFRDPSAWYHIVIAVNTTQSTASDRIKIYNNKNL